MHQESDARRLEHAMAEIDSLDLEPIKCKISCKEEGYGWSSEHLDRIEYAYRMKEPGNLPRQSGAGAHDKWGLSAVLESLNSAAFVGILMVDGTLVHANGAALDAIGATLA